MYRVYKLSLIIYNKLVQYYITFAINHERLTIKNHQNLEGKIFN